MNEEVLFYYELTLLSNLLRMKSTFPYVFFDWNYLQKYNGLLFKFLFDWLLNTVDFELLHIYLKY